MAKREVWWVRRWSGGYKPVSWKAWVWLGAYLGAFWPILKACEWLSRLAGFQNERMLGAVAMVLYWIWGLWFVERRSPKRR